MGLPRKLDVLVSLFARHANTEDELTAFGPGMRLPCPCRTLQFGPLFILGREHAARGRFLSWIVRGRAFYLLHYPNKARVGSRPPRPSTLPLGCMVAVCAQRMLPTCLQRLLLTAVLGYLATPCAADYCSTSRANPPIDHTKMKDRAYALLHGDAWAKDYMAHHGDRPYSEHKFVSTEWMHISSSNVARTPANSWKHNASAPRRILDLSSGPGWFVWALRQRGFFADGLQPMAHNQAPPKMTSLAACGTGI